MRGALTKSLLVAAGGAAGSVLRYAVSDWVQLARFAPPLCRARILRPRRAFLALESLDRSC
jgi:hypothetical protein